MVWADNQVVHCTLDLNVFYLLVGNFASTSVPSGLDKVMHILLYPLGQMFAL